MIWSVNRTWCLDTGRTLAQEQIKLSAEQARFPIPGSVLVLNKLLGLHADTPTDQQLMTQLIESDPGLFYSVNLLLGGQPITAWSPTLDYQLLYSLVLAYSLCELGRSQDAKRDQLVNEYRLHSVATAHACAAICRQLNQAPDSTVFSERQAYVSGLLSGIGQLQLLQQFGHESLYQSEQPEVTIGNFERGS